MADNEFGFGANAAKHYAQDVSQDIVEWQDLPADTYDAETMSLEALLQEPPKQQWQPGSAQIGMAMKLLISPKEASVVLGTRGATSKEISEATGCQLHLSGKDEFYPGTMLQELIIKGSNADAVGNAILSCLQKIIADSGGTLMCGDQSVEPGGGRLKLVVPMSTAKAIIGRGGENIRELRTSYGVVAHIEEQALPNGDTMEQLVSLKGTSQACANAVPWLVEKMLTSVSEPWFMSWVFSSSAAGGGKGGKGIKGSKSSKGKGKDSWGFQSAVSSGNGAAAYHSGMRSGVSSGGIIGPPSGMRSGVSNGSSIGFGPDPAAALTHAAQMLPSSLMNPQDRSQVISMGIAAELVSPLIGKGGAGVKEITQACGAKVAIRDAEGTNEEKIVLISGNALSVAAAYLMVATRLAELEQNAVIAGPKGSW